MVFRLEVGYRTDKGLKRQRNEDYIYVFRPKDPLEREKKGDIFLVADGMGGHPGGEYASRYIVAKVLNLYKTGTSPDISENLLGAINKANASLYARSLKDPSRTGMGTTLVAAVLRGDELWVANVGDSRAYIIRQGHIRQITRDHSLLALEERISRISTGYIKNRPGRNIIVRALGTNPSVKVDIFREKVRPGDIIVLCTDGLTNSVRDEEISRYVSTYAPQEAANHLVNLANRRGGEDNISVIVVAVHSTSEPLAADFMEVKQRPQGLNIAFFNRFLKGVDAAELNKFFSQITWAQLKRSSIWSSLAFWTLLFMLALALIGCGFIIGFLIIR